MSSIATVVLVICVAALACSFVSIVAPQGSTNRILNTVLGAFILCSMIVPIKNAVTDFNVNVEVAQSSDDLVATADEAYNNAVLTETKALLESRLCELLSENGINVEEVSITLAVNENNGIYIDSASIYILKKDESKESDIINLTKGKFEVTPNIITR